MKITKSLNEALQKALSQPLNQHSPKGNVIVEAKKPNKEAEGHAWQAEQHKAAAAKLEPGSKAFHFARAAYHNSMAEYHSANGHENLAAHHDDKHDDHIEKAHGLKEEEMTPGQKAKREDIVKGMKKNAEDFKKRYGEDWEGVMYATATKKAMTEESVEEIIENWRHENPASVRSQAKAAMMRRGTHHTQTTSSKPAETPKKDHTSVAAQSHKDMLNHIKDHIGAYHEWTAADAHYSQHSLRDHNKAHAHLVKHGWKYHPPQSAGNTSLSHKYTKDHHEISIGSKGDHYAGHYLTLHTKEKVNEGVDIVEVLAGGLAGLALGGAIVAGANIAGRKVGKAMDRRKIRKEKDAYLRNRAKHEYYIKHGEHYKEDLDQDNDDTILEMIDESYRYLRRGESSGRHYKDEHGVTWDDEGHNSAGTGPSDRAYRAAPKHKYPPKQKHYHSVPYAKKEEAKGEGMKWDGDKKKWYHTDAGKSATSKFKKLDESYDDDDYGHHDHSPPKHKVGDKVHYTGDFGGGQRHRGEITGHGTKNGERVYDVKLDNGREHWGYEHQFKKIHEESLDEAINISARNKRGTMSTLTGKKIGSGNGHEVYAGSVKHEDGQAAAPHHVWVMKDGKNVATIATHDPEEHKKNIETAKKYLNEEAKKAEKPKPGELNKTALDDHLTKAEKKFMGFDNVRAKEAVSDIQKMRSISPNKLVGGISAHLDHIKGLEGFVTGASKKPELTEELMGEMFNRDTGHSEKDSEKPKGHLISVTVSDPDHPSVSKRDEKIEKRIRVKGVSKDSAMKKAQSFYKKSGYKVHDVNHVKHLYEEAENDFGILAEEHNTREQAEKRMAEIEKKHPLAKHSVMQGRRSGKWHVVRHTSGGMHVIESAEEEEYILEGDESEADFQSYLKAHRAGLDHHTKQDADIDNDGKKNDPNDKYLRNRRATIAKNIAKGKK